MTIYYLLMSIILLGTTFRKKKLKNAVNMINKLNPDLVLFPGDTIENVK